MSEEKLLNVHEAIIEVSRRVGAVGKTSRNDQQKFDFRGIDDLVAAIYPALMDVGLTIIPLVERATSQDRIVVNSYGEEKTARVSSVIIKYMLTGPDGSSIVASMAGEAFDFGDKSMSKAEAQAAKYFINQTFWLPTHLDDADLDSYEAAAPRPAVRYHNPETPPTQLSAALDDARAARPVKKAAKKAQAPLRERVAAAAPQGEKLTEGQSKNLYRLWKHVLEWDRDRYAQEIQSIAPGVTDDRNLTKVQAGRLITQLKAHAGETDEQGGRPVPNQPTEAYDDTPYGTDEDDF